ncbi:MAG: secondary thiamine-phosphate synthase enzyme YjbQ [Methanocellales archaeon]|nr:secondary thiamine-phosphate synthase enzyme YjbQ [Methanocellales archaeon]
MNIEVQTSQETELVDITQRVKETVGGAGIRNGLCVVYTPHTTTGIIINENEARLREDILSALDKVVPKGAGYQHDQIDHNAHSHLRAILLGPSAIIPIENGSLALGTWQSIFLVELDGPRKRTVHVSVR